MNVVGLDLSLTAVGVSTQGKTSVLGYPMPSPATYMDEVRRLRHLSARIDVACREADVVVIENFPSRANYRAHQMGEIHGLVKVVLLQRGTPFALVDNTQLKKYATGRGNASKDEVLAAAIREGYPGSNNNGADAWWLRIMGLGHYLNRDEVAPKHRKEVLGRIAWPLVAAFEREEQAVG